MASKRLGFVSDGSSLVGEDLKETQTFPKKKKLKQKVCFFFYKISGFVYLLTIKISVFPPS